MPSGTGTACGCPLKRWGQEATDSSLAAEKKKNNPGQMVQKKLKAQKEKKRWPVLWLEKEIYF